MITKPDVKTTGSKSKGYRTELYVDGELVAVGAGKTRSEAHQAATNMFLSNDLMKSLSGLTK